MKPLLTALLLVLLGAPRPSPPTSATRWTRPPPTAAAPAARWPKAAPRRRWRPRKTRT